MWGLEPSRMPKESPPGADNLAVAHLHSVLLPALGFTTESYLDGTVSYRSDPEVLFDQVRGGSLAVGIWLPPMTSEAFGLAMADLEMPQGVDFAARRRYKGFSLRIVRDYDINNDNFPCRVDVLYGVKTLYDDMAVRLFG